MTRARDGNWAESDRRNVKSIKYYVNGDCFLRIISFFSGMGEVGHSQESPGIQVKKKNALPATFPSPVDLCGREFLPLPVPQTLEKKNKLKLNQRARGGSWNLQQSVLRCRLSGGRSLGK